MMNTLIQKILDTEIGRRMKLTKIMRKTMDSLS